MSTMGCNTKMEIAENTQASFSSRRPYSDNSKIASAKSEKCRVLVQPAKSDSLVAKNVQMRAGRGKGAQEQKTWSING